MRFRLLNIFSAILILYVMCTTASVAAKNVGFTGKWQTAWGPVTLTQSKNIVKGTYTGSFSGVIEGTVKGKRLSFKWTQPNGEWGRGYFNLSPDGKSFTGRWGGYDSDTAGGEWNGKK